MATEQQKQQIAGLTRDDLLLIIQEMRKPVKSEKEIRDEKQAEEDRANMQETLKRTYANKLANQAACSHMRNNGSTTCVFIVDLTRLYCQACQKWILPNETDLWNKLYPLAI